MLIGTSADACFSHWSFLAVSETEAILLGLSPSTLSMSSDAELLRGPTAKRLLSAGVPREEVLANLRATSSPQPHDALPTPQAPSGGRPAILTRPASPLSRQRARRIPIHHRLVSTGGSPDVCFSFLLR